MDIEITSASRAEAAGEALSGLLGDYIAWGADGFRSSAGIEIDQPAYVTATMSNISAYLPPLGRLLLARDADATIVGMVFVKTVGPKTAEIKRLYVAPTGRGAGVGRRLAYAAVQAAGELGAERVLLDTGRWMEAALALYRDMGFREIAPYPESENDPSMAPYLVYMELRLDG